MTRLLDDGGHGSGGGFHLEFGMSCHRCGKSEKMDVVNETWLSPYHVPCKIDGKDGWLQTALCPSCARFHLRYWVRIAWKWRIGWLSDLLASGFSHCGRCKTNWHYVKEHSTQYGDGGCFPLCQRCWAELTPETRLPYYRALFESWKRWGPVDDEKWSLIEQAVKDGG